MSTQPSAAAGARQRSRGPEGRDGPRLRDVADRAGVSIATASRVLAAGREQARTQAHLRVLAAADELGYVVNGLARSMMGVGVRSVAFLSHVMVGPTFASMAAGAEGVASSHEHLFLQSTTHGDVDRESALIDSLCEQRAAAVLLVGATVTDEAFAERARDYSQRLERVGARLVLCGRPQVEGLPEVPSIDYDHVGGMRAAVAHLSATGRARIGYVGRTAAMTTPVQRFRGFQLGLDDAGLEQAIDPIETDNVTEDAHAAVAARLRSGLSVDALVCQTDAIAVGVYRALRESGVAIPETVAVTGFDDTPFASDLTPSLATVRAPFFDVGVLAGKVAIGLEPYREPVVLPTTFLARASAG